MLGGGEGEEQLPGAEGQRGEVQPGEPLEETRHQHHANQVWHLIHRQASQSGRSLGPGKKPFVKIQQC